MGSCIIQEKLHSCREDLNHLLKSALIELKGINTNYSTYPESLIVEKPTFRYKSIESVKEKIQRKNINAEEFTVELKDLIGIRVICADLTCLKKVCERLEMANHITINERKEWIDKADDDGYRGVHFVFQNKEKSDLNFPELRGEIQIRTIAQHFWSVFSHRDLYKTNRLLLERTSDRVQNLSDVLYRADLELQRLEKEVSDNPLAITPVSLQSLFNYLGFIIPINEIYDLYELMTRESLSHLVIPDIQPAIISSALDKWINDVYIIVFGKKPSVIELMFVKIYADAKGFYWPKRRILEWIFIQKKAAWNPIINSDNPRTLLLLLEASIKPSLIKHFYTLQSVDRTGMTWSFLVDNRYTTTHLTEQGYVERKVEENIITYETAGGTKAKHGYHVVCTPKGKDTAEMCLAAITNNSPVQIETLMEIEIEDFPDNDELNWGLPASTSFSSTIIPEERGPNLIDEDWWNGVPGYY